MKVITIRLSDELHKALREICLKNETSMQSVALDSLVAYANSNRDKLGGKVAPFKAQPSNGRKQTQKRPHGRGGST